MTAKRSQTQRRPLPRRRSRSRAGLPDFYTVERYETEDNIGFMMSEAKARLYDILDVRLGRMGFTAAQWPILRAVARGTPTAAELCRKLNYDTGSMTRMLNRLEGKGLIRRLPSRRDRRLVELKMTPAGKRLYPKLRSEVVRVLNMLLIGFKPSEINQAHDLVRRMLDNVTAGARAAKS
jgi:DNA-binding MarR family transcriptional regulator